MLLQKLLLPLGLLFASFLQKRDTTVGLLSLCNLLRMNVVFRMNPAKTICSQMRVFGWGMFPCDLLVHTAPLRIQTS